MRKLVDRSHTRLWLLLLNHNHGATIGRGLLVKIGELATLKPLIRNGVLRKGGRDATISNISHIMTLPCAANCAQGRDIRHLTVEVCHTIIYKLEHIMLVTGLRHRIRG